MKLKKKVKKKLIIFIVIVLLAIGGVFAYKYISNNAKGNEVKVVDKISKYGYRLKENKPERYKKMFKELKDILSKDKVDEEAYAKKIAEMYIYDFYSLDDKAAKTDIGGVDFIYNKALENYLQNAQNTYYKYVESNIYGNRKQKLPIVDEIEIVDVTNKEYTYGEESDDKAYYIDVKWNYTDDEFSDYQNKATLVFIHDDIKLCLVELD